MNRIATLTAQQRQELFREAAINRGMSPAVMEKDFWVCWVLKQLFSDPELKRLVFKGGTSLSKVFKVIDRFSEDIDLVLDWGLLGYGHGQEDPYQLFDSATKQDRFNKRVNAKAAEYLKATFVPRLNDLFSGLAGTSASIDRDDPHTVNVAYPAAFSERYLRPIVRLEIGPLVSWVPSATHTIQPYAAEVFPEQFQYPACPVVAIAAERTFWEKATILHKEAHRTSSTPLRHSRHYYDIYKLTNSSIRQAALADIRLLNDVVSFKRRFYPTPWARYDLATPRSFRLSPAPDRLPELRKDYREMEVMIFGEIPPFGAIMDAIGRLETEINQQHH